MEEPATTPQLLSNRPLYNQVAYGGLYKGAKSVSLRLKALEPNLQDLDSLAACLTKEYQRLAQVCNFEEATMQSSVTGQVHWIIVAHA